MDWLFLSIIAAFAALGAACMLLVAVSLPGTWILLAMALIVELTGAFGLAGGREAVFGWTALGVGLLLAILGEVLEFIAGALGARHGGGTRRGMVGAIVGGFAGGILFTFLLPIPLVGTLVGAVVGTFVGAVIAEVSGAVPMTVQGSMRPAVGATIGRVLGTVGKVGVAFVIWIVLVVAMFLP